MKLPIICSICGKDAVLTGAARRRVLEGQDAYCSRECSDVSRAAKLSAANTGRIRSPEVKVQISTALKDRVLSQETRLKMSETHRRLGTRPPAATRCGSNGVPAECEALLLAALPTADGWKLHHGMPNGSGRSGAGGRWTIDLALLDIRLAIEIDGPSHRTSAQRAPDVEKESFLRSHGWMVL
jgi:hypothetical protein